MVTKRVKKYEKMMTHQFVMMVDQPGVWIHAMMLSREWCDDNDDDDDDKIRLRLF